MTHPVLERLGSGDPEERLAACRDAVDDPSAVLLLDALGDALGDPVRAVSRAASDALVELGQRVDGVDVVVKRALRGERPEQRWSAAFTQARLVPPGPALLPPLVEALGSDEGHVRWDAARLLVETGRLVGEVLPLLLGLARGDEAPVVRRMATHCLRQLAPDRPEAAAVLIQGTHDDDVPVRRASYAALSALLDPPPEVFQRLVDALDGDEDPASRRIAALVIGQLGGERPSEVPEAASGALRRAAGQSEDPDLRRAAERALQRIGAS